MSALLFNLIPTVAAAICLTVLLYVILHFRQYAKAVDAVTIPTVDAGAENRLRAEIVRLADRLAELESEPRGTAGVAVRAGMNLTKRTQALRQYRLGQGLESIATELDLTRAEVDLLLKIQQIVSR